MTRDSVNQRVYKNVIFLFVDENGEEESEEPPKPEVKEVKEDDAFYSKKYDCLFLIKCLKYSGGTVK